MGCVFCFSSLLASVTVALQRQLVQSEESIVKLHQVEEQVVQEIQEEEVSLMFNNKKRKVSATYQIKSRPHFQSQTAALEKKKEPAQ